MSIGDLIVFLLVINIPPALYYYWADEHEKHFSKIIATLLMFASAFCYVYVESVLHERKREREWESYVERARVQREAAQNNTKATEVTSTTGKKDGVQNAETQPVSSYKSSRRRSYDSDSSLGYDDGYEDGYEDGIHRDHGANKRSKGYDYLDGYSQGYYDAVHEDPDWEDDEEEDW